MSHRETDSRSAAEFRALRTRMQAAGQNHMARVIVITSGSRGEGKTTVTANLAAAFAEDRKTRVLVLDADVYGPMIAEKLGLKGVTRGINNVLVENLALEGAIYETKMPNLRVIPALVHPGKKDDPKGETSARLRADGSEINFDRFVGRLFQALRQRYDYIFVDTPPVILTSHAAVIAKYADGVIVVARVGKTPRQVVHRAVKVVEGSGGKVLGCVLTHARHYIPRWLYRLLWGTDPYYHYYYYRKKRGDGDGIWGWAQRLLGRGHDEDHAQPQEPTEEQE